jgi:mxaC protein
MEVARKVLKTLVAQGHDDLMGMVTFSTSPILAAPLGNDRAFVQAALDATEAGGMGFTAVARGLGMALDYFADQPVTGARAMVLVSDGGAHLDGKTQDMLRAMFMRQKASLYWIYLRSESGVSLKQSLAEGENIDAYPEYALHEYFQTLNVPYRVYEAENPQAVMAAVRDISTLKNKPTRYLEPVSRQDLSQYAYGLAWLAVACLIALYALELKRWQT